MINEHTQSVKEIFYTMMELLSTVLTQIEDLLILAKAAKKSYSDRQLVKIPMNIMRNANDFDKGQADWYGKIPVKHTWGYFKMHFKAYLRLLQKI